MHTYAGNAVLENNDMGWAMNEYRTALEIDPVQPDVMFRLGSLYIKRKMLGEARVLMEKSQSLVRSGSGATSSAGGNSILARRYHY